MNGEGYNYKIVPETPLQSLYRPEQFAFASTALGGLVEVLDVREGGSTCRCKQWGGRRDMGLEEKAEARERRGPEMV